jgi:hypothetical protein
MPLTLGDKAQRALRLLLAVRNPRIASALSAHGFDDGDIQEGWSLLQALGTSKLGLEPSPPAQNPETIQQLDAWENKWFPIADASLARRFPAVHARLFLNLSQTEGPEVAISVQTFLDRFDALTQANGPHGADGAKAKALLEKRGLTRAALKEARELLNALGSVAPAPDDKIVSAEDAKADLLRAEKALWGWYLEWSQVARIAIKQRVLLRQLGFLADRGGGSVEQDPEEPITVTTAPSPVAG